MYGSNEGGGGAPRCAVGGDESPTSLAIISFQPSLYEFRVQNESPQLLIGRGLIYYSPTAAWGVASRHAVGRAKAQ